MSIVAKSSWKSIPIPLDSKQPQLICFEELEDYEVISTKKVKSNSGKLQSKKEKRKQQRLLDFETKRQRLLEDTEDQANNNNEKSKKLKVVEEKPNELNNNKNNAPNSKKSAKKKKKNQQKKTIQVDLITEDQAKDVEEEEKVDVDMSSWDSLLVPEEIKRALKEMSFINPTEIQNQVIRNAIQTKQDVVAAAETGSGKTLAFGIPVLHHMMEDRIRGFNGAPQSDEEFELEEDEVDDLEDDVQDLANDEVIEPIKILPALILTPTRELAIQVKDHLIMAGKYTEFKIVAIVGGMSVQKQERVLRSKPDVIIATPGRLWEFIQQGNPYLVNLHRIRYLVIDEADRMLERGHFEELVKILDVVNGKKMKNVKRQTYMFSATLTSVHSAPNRAKAKGKEITKTVKLETLMNKIGIREKRHVVDLTTKKGTAEKLYEAKIICNSDEKDLYMYYFMRCHPGRTLVFTNSIDCIFHITGVMQALSLTPLHLHAKMQQRQRLKHLERFRENPNSILIASDVAARGLDIPDVEHVIHYQVPRTCETYIHRSGRSARTGKEGLSLLLVSPDELSTYKRLCRSLKLEDGIAQFAVDDERLTSIKKIVKLAKEIDYLGHRRKKVRLNNDWFSKAAAEMDIELDDDVLMQDHNSEENRVLLQAKEKQLSRILKQPIFPKHFSGKYLTKSGSLTLPETSQTSAIEQVKRAKKK